MPGELVEYIKDFGKALKLENDPEWPERFERHKERMDLFQNHKFEFGSSSVLQRKLRRIQAHLETCIRRNWEFKKQRDLDKLLRNFLPNSWRRQIVMMTLDKVNLQLIHGKLEKIILLNFKQRKNKWSLSTLLCTEVAMIFIAELECVTERISDFNLNSSLKVISSDRIQGARRLSSASWKQVLSHLIASATICTELVEKVSVKEVADLLKSNDLIRSHFEDLKFKRKKS